MANSKKTGKEGNQSFTQSFTAQTLLPDVSYRETRRSLYNALDDMGDRYGHIKRSLFRDSIRSGNKPVTFKNGYLVKYGITARQFNAIRYDLDGNISSAVETLKLRIINLEDKIKAVKRWIKTKENEIVDIHGKEKLREYEKTSSIKSLRFAIHNKNRKLHLLEEKRITLKEDLSNGRIRICFGSKKLFYKQFNLSENGYKSHKDWLADWKSARSSSSFCLGSKDETAGNQTCTLGADGSLRIRVPNYLKSKYGKYLVMPDVQYSYGQAYIDQALVRGQAITHRFVRGEKGWYLHSSVDIPERAAVTRKPQEVGCIGVDVNEDNISVSETDRFGNLVWHTTYPACVKDRTTAQTEAVYGDICAKIVDRAVKTGKSIAHETLDFEKKKSSLKEQGATYARMLSGFAYSTFFTMLDRRAFRAGVMVFTVNPAYTSVIGRNNYMARHGISPHESAAIVVARRVQKYSESPMPSRTASPLPARNRGEHVWKFWNRIKTRGGCGNHHSLYQRRSIQDSPGCAESQKKSSSTSTAQFSRPPAGRNLTGKAPRAIPINKKRDLSESGREPLTLTGGSTVRPPLAYCNKLL